MAGLGLAGVRIQRIHRPALFAPRTCSLSSPPPFSRGLSQRFAAVIMRIREPKTTALIFASGKMVCTGAKSEEQSRTAARKYARIIQKLGFPAKFTDFTIQNIVGSCDVKFPIRLEGLALEHSQYSSVRVARHPRLAALPLLSPLDALRLTLLFAHFTQYEPELFPGLIYRMVRPKIVLLIFVSGKIVLTGAKDRRDIYGAFDKMLPVLKMFRKDQDGGGAAMAQ